ncbi:YciI family protein [Bradyrhizobium sp. SZCCHNS2096]|uniref:YciI family protein n=1 Tax=Bradyrhizobium sp. SZCCHNS2096 TaxID=3057309 RepID=UPI002916D928|nr:YciI family protein [Bradyrhizobium sp. SZCCHNS2096]
MRFMVIVKATKDSEAGILPSTEEFAAMGRFNEELVKAGMMEAGEGLHPTAKGARIDFSDDQVQVTRGPFELSRDLTAGFWILKAMSLDEVIEQMKRAPFPSGEIEIRQVYAAEDFGEALTPELRAQEERLRARAANG